MIIDEKVVRDMISPIVNKELIFPPSYSVFEFAAVMIIIHFTNKVPHVILIKRSTFMKSHAGEISFPGGKFIKKDINMLETALREINEELGIKIYREQVVGYLNTVKTSNSQYVIYPYIALIDKISELHMSNNEVEKLIDAPLISLLKTKQNDEDHQEKFPNALYRFIYKGEIIWGATAKILVQLFELFTSKVNF